MRDLAYLEASGHLPRPADAAAATLRRERWRDAVTTAESLELRGFADSLDQSPEGRRLLDALFGNSPFLTECVLAEPEFLRWTIELGPDETINGVMTAIAGIQAADPDTAALGRQLRLARRRIALGTAIAEIGRAHV